MAPSISKEEKIELYNKLVTSHPDAVLKGDTIPYTSFNGHMYSYIAKDGDIGLRLPEEEREKFMTKYKTRLMEQYGIVQKEYVVIPDALLKKTKELQPYFDASYKYISTLKPKPTSKSRKK